MRIGIFSDVHANGEALDVVLKALEYEEVNRIFCLGDLVGYGPMPNECIERTMAVADEVVGGNHDYAATSRISTDGFNDYAKQAIEWTQKVLTATSIARLNNLPMAITEGDIFIVHATPEAPEKWHYIFTYEEARRNFEFMTTPLCFVGHSHAPAAFIQNDKGEISIQSAVSVAIHAGKKYIINVGSVGQPRDGDPRACYGVLDTDRNQFQLKRLPYPVEIVQEKMQKKSLPRYLIERLSVGR